MGLQVVAVTKRNLQECSLGVCGRSREFGAVSVDADGAKSIRLVLGVLDRQGPLCPLPPLHWLPRVTPFIPGFCPERSRLSG